METVLQKTLLGGAAILFFPGFLALGQPQRDSSELENIELAAADVVQDEPKRELWSLQTEALIQAFTMHKDNLNKLRDMTEKTRAAGVSLWGEDITVITNDGRRINNDDVENSDQWFNLMGESNIHTILTLDKMVGFLVRRPNTAPNRTEGITYFFRHVIPAKECSNQFRYIACGVCDVMMDDKWSIRYRWSSGEFEEEYSENLVKVYQDKESNLSFDDVQAKYDESKKACMQRGLEDMGYEYPENY